MLDSASGRLGLYGLLHHQRDICMVFVLPVSTRMPRILLKCSFKIFLWASSQITRVIAPRCNVFLNFWVIQPGNTHSVEGSWHDLTELGDCGPGRVSPNILACYWYSISIKVDSMVCGECVWFYIVLKDRLKLTMLTCGYSFLSIILTSMIKNSWLHPSSYISWISVIGNLCFLKVKSTHIPIICRIFYNFLNIVVHTITSPSYLCPRKLVHDNVLHFDPGNLFHWVNSFTPSWELYSLYYTAILIN